MSELEAQLEKAKRVFKKTQKHAPTYSAGEQGVMHYTNTPTLDSYEKL